MAVAGIGPRTRRSSVPCHGLSLVKSMQLISHQIGVTTNQNNCILALIDCTRGRHRVR